MGYSDGQSPSANYPFLARTEEGKIFNVINMMAREFTDNDTMSRVFAFAFRLVCFGGASLHAVLPLLTDDIVSTSKSEKSEWAFVLAMVAMSGLNFYRILYLSWHVLRNDVQTYKRLRVFRVLTSPDEYYLCRKDFTDKAKSNKAFGSAAFPPFLNLRNSTDIMRWTRTRELMIRISNSFDKRRHDIHFLVVVASTLLLCIFVVVARLSGPFRSGRLATSLD